MLKRPDKILTKVKPSGKRARAYSKGFFKNPLLYFGAMAFFLFGSLYVSCGDPANLGILDNNRVVFFNSFFNNSKKVSANDLFSNQTSETSRETPDLKIIQNNTLAGISVPYIVSGKVLGDVFGGSVSSTPNTKKEVIDYTVEPGDTLQLIANSFGISLNTLLWANELTSSSTIKVGQTLAVLPVNGIMHAIKSGDTVSGIAQAYKAKQNDIISYNNLANQDDIYIGDILIIPGGTKPAKSSPSVATQIPTADNYFIFPVEGKITQGLHYYNAVDIANECGTPIYAAAAGTVQRAVGNGGYNNGQGNHITILHGNGTVTYYGHLMTLLIKPGDKVYTGQKIALVGGAPGMAGAGRSTGCHLHFQVVGVKNPLAAYRLGSNISYK